MFLIRWIKRVDFIIKINHDRMHEIEGNLEMWKSLRVYGLNRWGPKNQDWDEKDLKKIEKFENISKDFRVTVGKK